MAHMIALMAVEAPENVVKQNPNALIMAIMEEHLALIGQKPGHLNVVSDIEN